MSSRKLPIRSRHVQSSRSKSTEELSSLSSEFCWNGAELYQSSSFYLASVASSTSSPIRISRSRSRSSQSHPSIHHHSSVIRTRRRNVRLCRVMHVPVAFSFISKQRAACIGQPGTSRGLPGPPGPGSELWPPRVLMAYSL